MPTSAIPAALTALKTASDAASSLLGVYISDGPPDQVPVGTKEYLALGADWDPSGAGPTGQAGAVSTYEPYSDYAQLETITITSSVVVWSGDDLAAQRNRASAILIAAKALIDADPTLGGTVGVASDPSLGGPAVEGTTARISATSWRQVQSGGAGCAVTFTISAVALVGETS